MNSSEIVQHIHTLLDEKKGEDIKIIDLRKKSTFADYMIIATALSTRQVFALSQHVEQFFKAHTIIPHIEGVSQCEWILVFGGDVVVHIFLPEIRSFYHLEKMWSPLFDENEQASDNHKEL